MPSPLSHLLLLLTLTHTHRPGAQVTPAPMFMYTVAAPHAPLCALLWLCCHYARTLKLVQDFHGIETKGLVFLKESRLLMKQFDPNGNTLATY